MPWRSLLCDHNCIVARFWCHHSTYYQRIEQMMIYFDARMHGDAGMSFSSLTNFPSVATTNIPVWGIYLFWGRPCKWCLMILLCSSIDGAAKVWWFVEISFFITEHCNGRVNSAYFRDAMLRRHVVACFHQHWAARFQQGNAGGHTAPATERHLGREFPCVDQRVLVVLCRWRALHVEPKW